MGGVGKTTQIAYEKQPGDPAVRHPSSEYLIALHEAGVDACYLITGKRLEPAGSGSNLENADVPGAQTETSEQTAGYAKSEPHPESRNSVPTSVVQVGTHNLIALGRVFFDAWYGMLETHGTDAQRELMTEVLGHDLARQLVADQFNNYDDLPTSTDKPESSQSKVSSGAKKG